MTSTAPKAFNKIRAAFMQRPSAPNINPFALKLAYLIAFQVYESRKPDRAPGAGDAGA